jgi:hypothetical protein
MSKVTLFDWQQPSADKIVKIFKAGGQVALDASDTGAGKTYIALDAMRTLNRRPLVLCPRSGKTSWQRLAAQFGVPLLDVITSQRLLYKNPYYVNKAWNLPSDSMLLFDEVHQGTSGPKTKTTEALGRTRVYKIPVLALSATVADSPIKLRGLGFLMELHDYNMSSFNRWCLDHGCYPSPFARGKLEFSKARKGREALKVIHAAMQDRVVRIRREDIPGFPEGIICSKLVDLDKDYTKQINEIYADMDDRLKRPAANELVLRGQAREKTECFKIPVLTELVLAALAEGTSPVVFLNFHSSREALAASLLAAGVHNISQIHGKQTDDERVADMDAFQNNTNHVAIVTTGAGGASINLHDLHGRPRVSFLSPSDKAIDMVQCLGRTHRTCGSDVIQTFVLAAGTVEEKVHRNLQRKINCIRTINDGDLAI